jgi:hypothetical protein
LDENELQDLKKGRLLAKQEAQKGKVEKATNFEMLKLREKEAPATGKKGAKSQQAKKGEDVAGSVPDKKAKTKAPAKKK